MSKKKLSVEERIKKEINRLNAIFKNIDPDKKKVAKVLIENLAFMTIQMELMMARINVDGVTIEYQNGENQWGKKKSPDVETYNSFNKQSSTIVKQLADMLPKEVENTVDDLSEFHKLFE